MVYRFPWRFGAENQTDQWKYNTVPDRSAYGRVWRRQSRRRRIDARRLYAKHGCPRIRYQRFLLSVITAAVTTDSVLVTRSECSLLRHRSFTPRVIRTTDLLSSFRRVGCDWFPSGSSRPSAAHPSTPDTSRGFK